MKKLYRLLLILLTFSGSALMNNVNAQFNAGGGVSFGTGIEKLGFNLRGGYLIGEKFNILAEGNLFGSVISGNTTLRWNAANLNGSYWIRIKKGLNIYPLAGANLSSRQFETSVQEPDGTIARVERETETDLGLNLGAGVSYKTAGIVPFFETKYVFGDASQGVFTLGFSYLFE